MTDIHFMKGSEFLRKIKKLGCLTGNIVKWFSYRGKGSHGTLFYGARFTIVRNLKDELKTGTLHGMLAQLGLTMKDISGV